LGYPTPADEVVDAHVGYASRLYRKPSSRRPDWQAVYLQAAPPDIPRAGVAFSVEGDRWLVSLAGTEPCPPADDEGFLAFARSLPSSLVYDAIAAAEPLSPIVATRSGENRLRRFERLVRWPERFIVMGDAACAFNPVYGQGMTVAALEAVALDECLKRTSTGQLGRSFQRRLARIVALPWALATGPCGAPRRRIGTTAACRGRPTGE
jgi:hypothetical protein